MRSRTVCTLSVGYSEYTLCKLAEQERTIILCLLAVAQKEHVENIVDIFKAVNLVSQIVWISILRSN